ncbi:MAG: branched-chain amino acid ABC transporter permease [Candidatus Nezhaarchaeales archaeon]
MINELLLSLIYTFIFGSMYLGIALGFSIVTGILRIFNLAYPIFFLIAAYGTWLFWMDLNLPFMLSIALSFVLVAVASYLVYKFVVNKFMEAEDYMLAALILIFLAVEQVISIVYPEAAGVFIPTRVIEGSVNVGPASLPGQYFVIALVSLIMTALYVMFFMKTKTGLIMRAISQSYLVSRIIGVNFNLMFVIAMILGSIPPAVVMLLLAPVWALNPFIGWTLFAYGIMVAVLGGLGNLKGTIIAAYVIGAIYSFVAYLINPRLAGLACLVVVVIILALKPRGLARAETIW